MRMSDPQSGQRSGGNWSAAEVAAGNGAAPEAVSALSRALSDPEPLVRLHAAWLARELTRQGARKTVRATRRRLAGSRRSTFPNGSASMTTTAAGGDFDFDFDFDFGRPGGSGLFARGLPSGDKGTVAG
jgi:hypothetical protein